MLTKKVTVDNVWPGDTLVNTLNGDCYKVHAVEPIDHGDDMAVFKIIDEKGKPAMLCPLRYWHEQVTIAE